MPVPFDSSAELYCSHTTHMERIKQLIATVAQNEMKLRRLKEETERKERILCMLRKDKLDINDGICLRSILQAVKSASS